MSRPPLPPRRSGSGASASTTDEEDVKPMGIAARIASLQLEQKGIGRLPSSSNKPPPPVPRPRAPPREVLMTPAAEGAADERPNMAHQTRPNPSLHTKGPDFLRLISRPPPPIPASREDPPPPPPRRLPPMPSKLPTPPSEPESEPEPEPDVYHDEPMIVEDASSGSCIKCHDFSYVDTHASQFPRHTVHSLDSLAHDLTAQFDTETEKCRALFTWMHHNIAYDCDAFFSGNLRPATAESTLQSGLAVCDGYAGLFMYLAERVGLQAMKVGGHGKGFGYSADGVIPFQPNHAWNCVLMDGEWRLIDCCWGAGALEGSTYQPRFTPAWFASSPAEFGRRHFPEDPGYQLVETPVSWEDYIGEPAGPVVFKDFYELSFNPYIIEPAVLHIQGGEWATFHIFKFCEHMSTEERDNYVYFLKMSDGTRTPLSVGEGGGWGATVYVPAGGGELSLYYVTTCGGQDGKGLGIAAFERANGRKAMAFGGMLRWTVV